MSGYKFNVFTGKLDLVGASAGVPFHSFNGDVNVDFPDDWYQQDSNGDFETDDQGNKIFLGSPTNGVHPLGGYNSPYQLDSDGNILWDSDESPLVDPNWRSLIVDGIATPLDTLETQIVYVSIQAKFTNLGKIWVGLSDVRKYHSIYIEAGMIYTVSIDDLRKIYIIGNAGEGVTFAYGTNEDLLLTSPDGSSITTPGGDKIEI